MKTHSLFRFPSDPVDLETSRFAESLRERLRSSGIDWEEVVSDREWVELRVAEADSERAATATQRATGEKRLDAELPSLEARANRICLQDEILAMQLYEKCEKRYRDLGDEKSLLRILRQIASLLSSVDGMDAAADHVLEECDRLERELG